MATFNNNLPLFDLGETRRFELGNGNWVDIRTVETCGMHTRYLETLMGMEIEPGARVKVRALLAQQTQAALRIADWRLVSRRADGSEVGLPFNSQNVSKLSQQLLDAIVGFINEVDAGWAAQQTGANDPLASEQPSGEPYGETSAQG